MDSHDMARMLLHSILIHFPKEVTAWVVGGLFFVWLVICPILFVIALFFVLRKVIPARSVSIINLIVASGAVVISFPTIFLHRGPVWVPQAIVTLLTVGWLVCAIKLFSRKRLAWCGSLLGAGALVFILVTVTGGIIPDMLYPGADIQNSSLFPFARALECSTILAFIGIAWTISLHLLFGLLRIRRDIFVIP